MSFDKMIVYFVQEMRLEKMRNIGEIFFYIIWRFQIDIPFKIPQFFFWIFSNLHQLDLIWFDLHQKKWKQFILIETLSYISWLQSRQFDVWISQVQRTFIKIAISSGGTTENEKKLKHLFSWSIDCYCKLNHINHEFKFILFPY